MIIGLRTPNKLVGYHLKSTSNEMWLSCCDHGLKGNRREHVSRLSPWVWIGVIDNHLLARGTTGRQKYGQFEFNAVKSEDVELADVTFYGGSLHRRQSGRHELV